MDLWKSQIIVLFGSVHDKVRSRVLKKTHSKLSYIPIDQGHEQNNDLIKSSGGAVGLTEKL